MLDHLRRFKWFYYSAWVVAFRLPHFFRADARLDGDGALHWIVMENILRGEVFALHPYGYDHLGLTEFFLAFLFVPFTGHTQLAYQLALTVVFFATALAAYLVAQTAFSQRAADRVLLLTALPHAFIQFMSVRPFGGHLLCATLGLWAIWCWLKFRESARAPAAMIAVGLLCGLAIYTNRIALMMVAALYGVWLLELAVRRGRGAGGICFSLAGLGAGLLPVALGWIWQPYPNIYPNARLSFVPARIGENAAIFVRDLLPAIFDVYRFPGLEESGFDPAGSVKSAIDVWQVLIALTAIPPALLFFRSLYRFLMHGERAGYGVLAGAVVAVNAAGILFTDIQLIGFSVRYFLPALLVALPLYGALAAGHYPIALWKLGPVRIARVYLAGHFFIYGLAYAHGYRPGAPIYTAEATPGAARVHVWLAGRGVRRCVGNFWIAYNLDYLSRLRLPASPTRALPATGIVRDPVLEERVIGQPLECVIQNPLLFSMPGRETADGRKLELLWHERTPIALEIRAKRQIEGWVIYLVRESDAAARERQRL